MAKNLLLWLVVALVLLTLFTNFTRSDDPNKASYTEFISEVDRDRLSQVTFEGDTITGLRKDGTKFTTIKPSIPDNKLLDDLLAKNVDVAFTEPSSGGIWLQVLISLLPMIFIIAFFALMARQMQGMSGRGGPLAFGKSKAKLLSEDAIKITFEDVAGVDEAKEEVQELVEFLVDPQKFQKLGGRIPRGTLLVGSPGTGKTLLAKAIAGEAKVPFFSISGSDFVEMFVGVGASRVRDMFEEAKKNAPCIIFIDEIDAVGRHRGAGLGNGHDEREQTLNQLLVEMDGFEGSVGVIVIAATNRPDVLDPALTRPGRFDRQVVVPLPDIRGREQILKVHMRRVPLGEDVDPSLLARGTPGFSGADLENIVNEAALFAARSSQRVVKMTHFELAKDKIMMGAERKSMVMSDKEKKNTAYHEAGHAIVGYSLPDHDMLYKITVVPRGRALGVTTFLPSEDRYSLSRRAVESQICSLFGGRVAEEMIHGMEGVTTGASNDIERATELARKMVTQWGFSESLGPLQYDEGDGEVFLGMSAGSQAKTLSPETHEKIDKEVRSIIDRNYSKATEILKEHEDKLHVMADALVEYETLTPEQVGDIMAGGKPRAPEVSPDPSPSDPKDPVTDPKKNPGSGPFPRPAEDS